jgi:mannan endo-1,4-beta-mannosidase
LLSEDADASRTLHRANSASFPLQLAPSVYDDGIFRGLDFILHESARRELKVILVLSDWWSVFTPDDQCGTCLLLSRALRTSLRRTNPGGVRQYADWSHAFSAEDCFGNRECRDMFKRNALNMISRTNTINGRRYRDDPTIFGWVRCLVTCCVTTQR